MRLITKRASPRVVRALGDRAFWFVLSTFDVDRVGDRVRQDWRLDDFSGRVLWAHDHGTPAIARSSMPRVLNRELIAEAEFPPAGLYPFADQIHDLLAAGFLGDASVGFRASDEVPNAYGGVDYLEPSLIEWSIVNIPALPQARIQARQAHVDRAAVAKWLAEPKERRMATRVDPMTGRRLDARPPRSPADDVEIDIEPDERDTAIAALRELQARMRQREDEERAFHCTQMRKLAARRVVPIFDPSHGQP